jgi:CHAD domain-containing protein
MFEIVTPSVLFHTQLMNLQHALPSVLDGQPSGIHDARIATRRIRELVPLVADERRWKTTEDLSSSFKRLGRSLGRVRDADVRVALLASLEDRIPHAAPTVVLVRQQRERERLELMRRVIKRLERLDAIRLVSSLARHSRPRPSILHLPARTRRWRHDLRSILVARAQAAADAIEHATGVYFPNRTHSVRIAIKRLRYATEIVHETGSGDLTAAIRELKKAQDILGDLHDRQELIDHLTSVAAEAANGHADYRAQVSLIRQAVDAEVRHLHRRYLDRRDRLMCICRDAVHVPATRLGTASSLVAVGALAVSSSFFVASRWHRRLNRVD